MYSIFESSQPTTSIIQLLSFPTLKMLPTHVVAVMGVTGAGKSSFIKLVTRDERIKIGHGLESETSEVKGYETCIKGQKIVLVDTPGFNDTFLSDSDVLKMIAEWLESSYRGGTKLSAIIYMHPINQPRMHGSALRNLAVFKQLCGEGFYRNITLGTSCWSLVSNREAVNREEELKANIKFWKPMIARGSSVVRIPDSVDAAKDVVINAVKHSSMALQLQVEMVDRGVRFDKISATRELNIELEELREKQAAEKRRLLEEQEQAKEIQRQRKLTLQREAEKSARQARVDHHCAIRAHCALKRPFGTCDKSGCSTSLKDRYIVYHCCSCNSNDNFWHCSSCGNDCGNDEHPYMLELNVSSGCIMM
ncbi:hypothetical protein IQ07DRAFT_553401 [Pyrenochaeta sp. DS3sAY3a]|nr:hypothetical protein IQ07DRAFT_553401 [Pyrenochaeta sp. DS3sAY3a]